MSLARSGEFAAERPAYERHADTRSIALVHYPLMIVRYRYAGEARAELAPQDCYVALCGRTGKIVADEHPSAWRSVGSKIKKWIG